jgi:hypothetical protein
MRDDIASFASQPLISLLMPLADADPPLLIARGESRPCR